MKWCFYKAAKERQRLPANHRKLGKRHGTDPPSWPAEGSNPADALISDFSPPEPKDRKFLLLMPPSLWHFVMETIANEYSLVFYVNGTPWSISEKWPWSHSSAGGPFSLCCILNFPEYPWDDSRNQAICPMTKLQYCLKHGALFLASAVFGHFCSYHTCIVLSISLHIFKKSRGPEQQVGSEDMIEAARAEAGNWLMPG